MNKAVFLFGAGAVLDWCAPKTLCHREKYTVIEDPDGTITNRPCCLTHMITVSGFKNKEGQQITQLIYDKLKVKNSNANFEDIINIIEELYNYFAYRRSSNTDNLYRLFGIELNLENFIFFHIETNVSNNSYNLTIPGNQFYQENFIPDTIPPEEKYFEWLLNDTLCGIIGHISRYSHVNKSGGDDPVFTKNNLEINELFTIWMKTFSDRLYGLRLYTCNYDKLFKALLSQKGIECFDGFANAPSSESYFESLPDLQRILAGKDQNIHYNLHGCASWTLYDKNISQLPGYQFLNSEFEQLYNPVSVKEIERGKNILLTNIITGFQKVQRTAISPFRQIFSAFDLDCLEAKIICIVGYSFSDEHINDIISNARKFNKDLKIIIVDPSEIADRFFLDFISNWGMPKQYIYKNLDHNIIHSAQYNVTIYKMRFVDFLKSSYAFSAFT